MLMGVGNREKERKRGCYPTMMMILTPVALSAMSDGMMVLLLLW